MLSEQAGLHDWSIQVNSRGHSPLHLLISSKQLYHHNTACLISLVARNETNVEYGETNSTLAFSVAYSFDSKPFPDGGQCIAS